MPDTLLDKICHSDNLPSLPTVAIEVLRLSRTEDASIDDLVEVIQQDPALTAKILKTVNSALFSLSHRIGSLKQAVGLLGLRSVKVIALSFSLVDTVNSDSEDEFNFEIFWRRSLNSAVAARLLAQSLIPYQAGEAFVAALLADLGIIAAWRVAPEMYQPVLSEWNTTRRPLVEIEKEKLGFTHAQLNRRLLEKWNLPDTICQAIGNHHEAWANTPPDPKQMLPRIIYSASTIAELFCHEIPSHNLERVITECCTTIGIQKEKLEKILKVLDQHVHEMASLLSVKIGETSNYDQIQADASAQLAQLSIQAEMERLDSSRREMEAQNEIRQLHDEKRTILEVASTDGLTKIANRAAFDKRLTEELELARTEDHPLGLIVLDLDHFKQLNDTYGHLTGDEVLRHVARCMNEIVQPIGFPARYGGEEFVIIIARKTAECIRELAEEIRGVIEDRPLRLEGHELKVTASFGAACIPSPTVSDSPEQLFETADQCLYRAKCGGRNRVEM